jgi:hypothetical protein
MFEGLFRQIIHAIAAGAPHDDISTLQEISLTAFVCHIILRFIEILD